MTRYTVYKHQFFTEGDNELHVIEFIVSVNNHPISQKTIKKVATEVLKTISSIDRDIEGTPVYNFGSLKTGALLDDIKKLIKLDRTKRKGVRVQIWYDKNEEFAFWDDGID